MKLETTVVSNSIRVLASLSMRNVNLGTREVVVDGDADT